MLQNVLEDLLYGRERTTFWESAVVTVPVRFLEFSIFLLLEFGHSSNMKQEFIDLFWDAGGFLHYDNSEDNINVAITLKLWHLGYGEYYTKNNKYFLGQKIYRENIFFSIQLNLQNNIIIVIKNHLST